MTSPALPGAVLATLRAAALAAISVMLLPSPAASQELRIVAMDYAFRVPQKARPGVNRFVFVNQGKELHHMIVMRLPDSLDASGAYRRIRARQPIPGSRLVGGPGGVAPGDSGITWVTLEPGRHLVICFILAADGTPHMMKGMVGQIVVAGPRLRASPPRPGVIISAREYDFRLSRSLRAGATTIEMRNDGVHDHDLQILQLTDSGTAIAAARSAGRGGGSPSGVRVVGGISSVSPKGRAWGRLTLRSGRYAVVCYESDETRRGSHYLHGMAREFTVR